jgi:hypothetical protein
MKTKFPLFLMAIALVLSCNRCKEECDDASNPECPNYVAPVYPCAGHSEVSADFTIEMNVYAGTPVWYESDYCIADVNEVRITALLDDAISYTWILGLDTINTQQHVFNFPAIYAGMSLPITLIVIAEPDTLCYPNDDGLDTITRYVTITDICTANIYGTFRGALDDTPTDSFEVKIRRTACTDQSGSEFHLINIDQQGDSCGDAIHHIGNNYVWFSTGNSACSSARGYAELEEDLYHIYIPFQLMDDSNPLNPSEWPMHHFRGYKISN